MNKKESQELKELVENLSSDRWLKGTTAEKIIKEVTKLAKEGCKEVYIKRHQMEALSKLDYFIDISKYGPTYKLHGIGEIGTLMGVKLIIK